MADENYIRNFAIITHIDPEKSALSNRLIEYFGTKSNREMKEKILNSKDI